MSRGWNCSFFLCGSMLDANAALILHSLSLALPVLQSLHPPTHTHASSLCSREMNFSPGAAIQDAFSLCESEMRGNTRTQAEGLMNASGFYFAARGKCAPLCYAITGRWREALRKKNHHRRICLHALWGSAQSAAPVLKWALGFILLPELILLQNAICACSCGRYFFCCRLSMSPRRSLTVNANFTNYVDLHHINYICCIKFIYLSNFW